MATKKRTIMEEFEIDELSGVDFPAMEGAKAILFKRHDPDDVEKRQDPGEFKNPAMTDVKNGSQHLLDASVKVGRTTSETSEGQEFPHSHATLMMLDSSIRIAVAEGHDHEVLPMDKSATPSEDDGEYFKRTFSLEQRRQLAKEGKALPDGSFPIVTKADLSNAIQAFGRAKNKGAVAAHIKKRARALGATDLLPEEGALAVKKSGDAGASKEHGMTKHDDPTAEGSAVTQEQLDEAKKRGDRFEKLAELTDAQKAHLKGLPESEQEGFLKLDADGRQNEVDKAKADDPVVYKDLEGNEYRKSDDERVVSAVKRADRAEKTATQERDRREDGELTKRAADLKFVKGEDKVKKAMLRAIDGIEDEDLRKGVLEIISAANSGMKQAFETRGTAFGDEAPEGSPEQRYEKLSQDYAKTNSCTIEKARSEVIMDPANADLAEELAPNAPVYD